MGNMGFIDLKKEIINNDLCSGCGTCVGICPRDCLKIDLGNSQNPIFSGECAKCGLCYNICPGKGFKFPRPDQIQEGLRFDERIGIYHSFFTGSSTDERVRALSASGGIATSFLQFLLKERLVDRAIIVSMNEGLPALKTIERPEETLEGLQSKYGFIPLNKLLKEINDSGKSYAMIGLPCHFQGIENSKKYLRNLDQAIKFKIGLLCGYTQTYDSIDFVAKRIGLKNSAEYTFLGWREGAYPGNIAFKEKKTGKIFYKSLYEWLSICVPFFSLNKCFLCPDGSNELADFVLGDVHSRGNDENIIMTRNERAAHFLIKAQDKGYIDIREISFDEAMKGTIGTISNHKRARPIAVIQFLQSKGKIVPEYNINLSKVNGNRKRRMMTIIQFKFISLLRTRSIKKLLLRFPWLAEKLGSIAYFFPAKLPGYRIISKTLKFLRGLFIKKYV